VEKDYLSQSPLGGILSLLLLILSLLRAWSVEKDYLSQSPLGGNLSLLFLILSLLRSWSVRDFSDLA
jgi:hypothetical protein